MFYKSTKQLFAGLATIFGTTLPLSVYSLDFHPTTAVATITYANGNVVTENFAFKSEQEFTNTLENKIINNPNYDLTQERPDIVVVADIQGAELTVSTSRGSNLLHMTSKDLNIDQSFEATSRAQSTKQLEDWVKSNASGLIKEVNTRPSLSTVGGTSGYLARTSAYDASIDGEGSGSNVLRDINNTERSSHLSVLTGFSNYDSKGRNAKVYNLPISFNWEIANGWALLFNVPLNYIETDGVASYSGSVGTGLRIPMSKLINTGRVTWDLIPLFRIGAIGSDQNSIETSMIYSGGLQSNVGLPLGNNYSLVINNQYNHYTVTSFSNFETVKVNGNVLDVPDIGNDIYRNGVQLIKDFDYKLFGRILTSSISFADTRLTGTRLAIDNQQEIGFSIGLRGLTKKEVEFKFKETADDILNARTAKLKKKLKQKADGSEYRIGFKYTRADNIDNAFGVNFSSTF
jgi:hypothetical protein